MNFGKFEPYICEGVYCILIDTFIVVALLIIYRLFSWFWFGILTSIVFIILEYFLNIKVCILCIIDKIQEQTITYNGKIQSLEDEKSFSARFGSVISSLYEKKQHVCKSKLIIKDDYGNERWCRVVMPLGQDQEIIQIIECENIDTMNFIIGKHSRVLLKCDVTYSKDVSKKDISKINNYINHINCIRI